MLPTANRIRKTTEYQFVFRNGKRKGNSALVVYAVKMNNLEADLSQVGFVVGKTVGNSVVRHRLTRKLRHIMRQLLPHLIPAQIVIRTLKPAADLSSEELTSLLLKEFRRLELLKTPEIDLINSNRQTDLEDQTNLDNFGR